MNITEKVQPRRLAPGTTEDDLETYGGGEPIETALTGALADVAACTEEAARLGERLTTPEMSVEDRKRHASAQNSGQAERAQLNASNLGRAPEVSKATGVEPATLLGLLDKRSVLARGRRGGLLVQSDAADGKLMLGGLFRFAAGKVDAAVAARLQRLPADSQERRDLLADTAEITARQAELARRGQDAREENADEVARLAEELQVAQDELGYLSLQQQLGEGQQPDAALVDAAGRHAERQKEGRRSLAAEASAAPERRSKRRR